MSSMKSVARIFADALYSYSEVPEFWDMSLDDPRVRAFKTSGELFVPKSVRASIDVERTLSSSYASWNGIYDFSLNRPCTFNASSLEATPVTASDSHSVDTVVAPVTSVTTVTPAVPAVVTIFPSGPAVSGCTEFTKVPERVIEIGESSNSRTPSYHDLVHLEDFSSVVSPDPDSLPLNHKFVVWKDIPCVTFTVSQPFPPTTAPSSPIAPSQNYSSAWDFPDTPNVGTPITYRSDGIYSPRSGYYLPPDDDVYSGSYAIHDTRDVPSPIEVTQPVTFVDLPHIQTSITDYEYTSDAEIQPLPTSHSSVSVNSPRPPGYVETDIITFDSVSTALTDPSLCFWPIIDYLTPEGRDKFVLEHYHYTGGISAFTLFKFLQQFSVATHVPAFVKLYFDKLHLVPDHLITRDSALKFLYSNRFARVGYTDLYYAKIDFLLWTLENDYHIEPGTSLFVRHLPSPTRDSYPLAAFPMGNHSFVAPFPSSALVIHRGFRERKFRYSRVYDASCPVTADPSDLSYIHRHVTACSMARFNSERKQRLIRLKTLRTIRAIRSKISHTRKSDPDLATREGLINLIPGSVSMNQILDRVSAMVSEVPVDGLSNLVSNANNFMSNGSGTVRNASVVLDFFASVVTYLRDIHNDFTKALDYLQKIIEKIFSWFSDFFPEDTLVPMILKSITPHDATYTFFWVCLIGILLWNIIFSGRHINKLIIIILLIAVPFLSHFNILSLLIQYISSLTGDSIDDAKDETFFDSQESLAEREGFSTMDWSKPLIMLVSTVTFIGANKFTNCNSWMADQTASAAKFGSQFNSLFNGMKNWNSMIDSAITETVDEWTKFDTTLFGLTGILAESVREDFVRLDQIEHWPNRESLYSDPDFHDELLRISERLRKYMHETDKVRFPARFNERLIKADRLLTGFITESTKRKGQEDNFRFDPIHTSFYGEPGVGKSFLVNVMIHDILDFFGKPKLNRIFYRNPAVPFFSGYCGQHAMMIDDANSLKTDLDAIDSLQLKSSVPHQVNMAALADKGRMFTSEFIFSTTNEKLFSVSRDIKFSGAINRRRDILIEVEKDGDFVPNPTQGKRFFLLNPLDGNRISEGMDYFELMMTLLPFYEEMYRVRKQATEDMNACRFKTNWRDVLTKYRGESGQTKFDYKDPRFKIITHKCIEAEEELAAREILEKVEVQETDPMLIWSTRMVELQPNFYMIRDPNLAEEFLALPDEDQKRAIYYYKNYVSMEIDGAKLAEYKLMYAREMRNVNIFVAKVKLNEDSEFIFPENDTYYKVLFENMSEIQRFTAFEILKHKYTYESLHEAKRLGWCESETKEIAQPFLSMLSPATKCTIGAVAGTAVTYGVLSFIKGWTSKGKPVERVVVDNKAKELVEDTTPLVPEARVRRVRKVPVDPYSNEKINRDPNVKKLVFEERTFDDFSYYFKTGGGVKDFNEVIKTCTTVLSCQKDHKYYVSRGDYQIRNFKFTLKYDSIILATKDFKINKYVYLAEELVRPETLVTKSVEFPQDIEILDSEIGSYMRASTTLYDLDESSKAGIENAHKEGSVDPAGWDFGFKKVYNNTGFITSRLGSLHCLMLGPSRMILPKHFFFHKKECLEDGADIELRIKEVIYNFKYYANEVYMHPEKDLAMWEIPSSIPHFPTLRRYIGSGEELVKKADLKGIMMPAFREVGFGRLVLHVGHTANVGPNFTTRKYSLRGYSDSEAHFDDMLYELKGHEYFMNSTPGDCGAAIVGLHPNLTQKLVGIHIAGYHKGDSRGYSVILCKETIDKMDKVLNDRFWKGNYPHNIAPPPIEKLLDSGVMRAPKFKPDPRNHIVDTGFMREMDCPTINDKSGIIHSEIYGMTGFESVREPAILARDEPRNVDHIEPLLEGINKYSHDGVNLPKKDLNIIADYMGENITNLIGKQREGFGKVTADVAINGWAFEDYMEGLNMKTSAGWPFCVKIKTKDGKKSLFKVVGEQDNGAPLYEMCDELREAVQHKYDCVMSGAKSASLFFECLKDERLKPKKIYPVKTRLFSIADVATIIVSRMFMLDFCVCIMRNREKLGPQVGINCDSPQWDKLYERLMANSPYGFACDYSAFDSTQDGTVLDAACRVMNNVCNTGEKDALARATLFNEMYSRLTILGSKVVLLRRGLASGVSVTAIVNSIVNEIYLRFAWMHLARQYDRELISQENFDKFVVGVYYGDDNVVSVKPEVRDWYNLKTIATFLRKYGIIMTDAKKNALEDCEEYEDIVGLTFLKREFKIDPETGFVFAPLEKSSIEERPQWTHKNLTMLETLDNVRTSLRDAFHHGEEYFLDLQSRLRNACIVAKIGPFPTVTYGDLYQEWVDKRLEGKIVSSNLAYDFDRTQQDFAEHLKVVENEKPDIIGFQELHKPDIEVLKKSEVFDVFESNLGKHYMVTCIRKDLKAKKIDHPIAREFVFDLPDSGKRVAHCHFSCHNSAKQQKACINRLQNKNVDIIFGDMYLDNYFGKFKKATPDQSFVFQYKQSPDSALYQRDLKLKVLNAITAFGIDKRGLSDHKTIVYITDGF